MIRLLGLFVIATIVGLCGCKDKHPLVYRVVLQSLPESINPRTNHVNIYHYINLQLFYPMFNKKSDGELSSAFLDLAKTQSITPQFDQFQFCLIQDLRFSDGTPITSDHLRVTLEKVHLLRKSLPPIGSLELKNNCLVVKLKVPDINYFHELTGLQSTILSFRTDRGNAVGLGPYKIKEKTANKIVLERIGGTSGDNRFQYIEYIRYQPGIFDLKTGDIHDWNHLYQVEIPKERQRSFQQIDRPLLKTYYLLVRIRNEKHRTHFSECFPRSELLNYLNIHLEPTNGLIPKGLPGSLEQLNKKLRSNSNCGQGNKLPFIVKYFVYSDAQLAPLRTFIQQKQNLLPAKIEVIKKSLEETIIAASAEENFLTLVGADALDSSSEDFFNGFFGPGSFLFHQLKEFERLLTTAVIHRRTQKYGEWLLRAHLELLRSGYVIPLGQLVAEQKYPANIKNIVFADRIHGFPAIQEMELQ